MRHGGLMALEDLPSWADRLRLELDGLLVGFEGRFG
jgi:hypothetical protein